MLTSRGLGRVLGDLASMGFDARWGVLGAGDIGAPHQRNRIWLVATNTSNIGLQKNNEEQGISPKKKFRSAEQISTDWASPFQEWGMGMVPPSLIRVDDGMADRVDRVKAIGNGQVPLCAATAWRILSESL